MPTDASKKTKSTTQAPDLQALTEQNQALAAQNETLQQQLREVAAMLSLLHLKPAPPAELPLYRVENAKGVAISVEVTDPKTGQTRAVRWEKRNDFTNLFEAQIREIEEKWPHFFGDGYLVAPDFIAENSNAIANMPAFLASLDYDTIEERIEAITSVSTLWDIYHHIENLRYEYLDERGNPLVEKDHNGVDRPTIRVKKGDPKLLSVLMAVQGRIFKLSGVQAKVS